MLKLDSTGKHYLPYPSIFKLKSKLNSKILARFDVNLADFAYFMKKQNKNVFSLKDYIGSSVANNSSQKMFVNLKLNFHN